MSKIKEFYHEEICEGLYGSVNVEPLELTQTQLDFIESTKNQKVTISVPVGVGKCITAKKLRK